MVTFRHLKQYLFACLLSWLLFFSALSFAAEERILVRGVAADFIDILAMPEPDQSRALRAFVSKHRETLQRLSSAKSPGREILDSRVLGSAVDWTPEMDKLFVEAIDATFRHPMFLQILPFTTDLFQLVPDDNLKFVLMRSSAKLDSFSVSNQPGFRSILDPKTGVSIANPDIKKLAEEMLPKFYDSLPVRMKAKIIASVLRLSPDASATHQASEVLQSSGPIAQKLFQLIGRESNSPEMAIVLEELQANVKPIPQAEIVQVVEARLGKKIPEVFSSFSEPVASGTVGQVHFATLASSGEQVAVKVRRPGVEAAYRGELEALRLATKGTDKAQLVVKIESTVGRELNFLLESHNLKAGEVYINDKSGIKIASLVDGIAPHEDLLVMRKAEGMKINRFVRATDLVKRGEAMSRLLDAWVLESVFRDGFFHGDLHPGNVFFKLDDKARNGYELTMLDFGNAGRITLTQQKAFVKMLAAITLRSPEDLAAAIGTLGRIPDGVRDVVLADFRKALERSPHYPLDSWYNEVFSEILESCLKNKVDMPDSFLAFNRGKAFLEIELHEVNKLLDKVDPKQALKRFDATRVMAKVLLRQIPKVPANMLKGSDKSVLTFEMMREIAGMWKNSLYENSIQMCKQLFGALKKQ